MSPLGPTVTTGETSGASTTAASTGTAFVVGLADSGPFTATLLRSLNEYIATFGPRTSTSAKLYDWIDSFFALQGAQCYVARANSSAAKTAELTLNDSGNKPTLLVRAKYAGVYGNTLKIEVITESSEAEVRVLNSEGELLETSGKLKTQAEILAWAEKHTSYVTITQSEASEHTSNLPKTVAAKALTGGVNPSPTEAEEIATLSAFAGHDYGPGQVAFAGLTSEAAHVGLAEHAQSHNRDAWGDLEDQASTSSLIAEKGTLSAGIAPYINFTASSVIVQGTVPGTTRTVAASAIACALCAKVSAQGNDNIAPAGVNWPLEPYVLGFTKAWTQAEMETLNAAQINAFAIRNGVLCLYGFVSGIASTVDQIFWQATAVRTRMRLVARAKEAGEKFMFTTLDGRRHDIANFAAALQDIGLEEWEHGALFGNAASEASEVNVAEPINTLKTMQEGKLCAQWNVRISPFAEAVPINIVVAPVTETV